VGAQTLIIASRNPDAHFTSVDISAESLAQAQTSIREANLSNVVFEQRDLFTLPYADGAFDHVFVCFVLEHLPDPLRALVCLKRFLKPGGSMTVIEGDHGSAFFHPDSPAARKAVQCLIDVQAAMGGDSLIGRRLYPLLVEAGLHDVSVSPRMVYADAAHPAMVEGFTRNTFTAMVEGVEDNAIARGLIAAADWDRGIEDLYRTAESDGVFCYTFFKGMGIKE
ncbi:MAG: methyltransferase domain-containing protein, partial [Candidatus Hydrogenedentes bacterium]|nr:methyltransferase domain-containing protein [Candidatus Hydrogenedentota bacterium]